MSFSAKYGVQGMNCQSCERKVLSRAQSIHGVVSARADLELGQVEIQWANESEADHEALIQGNRAGHARRQP